MQRVSIFQHCRSASDYTPLVHSEVTAGTVLCKRVDRGLERAPLKLVHNADPPLPRQIGDLASPNSLLQFRDFQNHGMTGSR